jgi:hypothetical protein
MYANAPEMWARISDFVAHAEHTWHGYLGRGNSRMSALARS